MTTLQNYYMSAYAAVRASSAGCYIMVAPRTFEQDSGQNDSATPSSWQTFMSAGSGYSNVVLDLHKCARRSSTGVRPGLPSPNPGSQQSTLTLTCTRTSAEPARAGRRACCHKCWHSMLTVAWLRLLRLEFSGCLESNTHDQLIVSCMLVQNS